MNMPQSNPGCCKWTLFSTSQQGHCIRASSHQMSCALSPRRPDTASNQDVISTSAAGNRWPGTYGCESYSCAEYRCPAIWVVEAFLTGYTDFSDARILGPEPSARASFGPPTSAAATGQSMSASSELHFWAERVGSETSRVGAMDSSAALREGLGASGSASFSQVALFIVPRYSVS